MHLERKELKSFLIFMFFENSNDALLFIILNTFPEEFDYEGTMGLTGETWQGREN